MLEIRDALFRVANQIKCCHMAEAYPGTHEDCNNCILQIIVYDGYCLASGVLANNLKDRTITFDSGPQIFGKI